MLAEHRLAGNAMLADNRGKRRVDVAQFLLVTRVHHRHRFRPSLRSGVVGSISAAHNDDVAADARTRFLNH